MAKVVQVELSTPNGPDSQTRIVIWVDATLKPVPGMLLTCKGDQRIWEVAHAYKQTIEQDGINSTWKVGGL